MDYQKLQNGSDIRGVALGDDANLTEQAACDLAAAFAKWLASRGMANPKIAIGMDSRVTGPALRQACIEGFTAMGADVVDCGMASTPAMFMTTVTEGFLCDGAVMVTASHLPMNRNGLKFFTRDGGLEKSDIAELIRIAADIDSSGPAKGSVSEADFMSVYAGILVDKIKGATGEEKPFEGFKIIVDAGNGAGGFYVDKVLAPLGADTEGSQFLNPDGTFPNHIPNPENKEAMKSIVDAVVNTGADFGIIFDTDVDRAGAVDKGGSVLNKNRLIAAISAILLKEFPGTTIVTDSITSSGLAEFIAGHGGVHHRFKRGYKNVINESIRLNESGTDSQLAIETSGHAALKENYFLDDGAYLVTRLLIEMAKLKKQGHTISDLIADLKEPLESEEFRLNIGVDDFKAYGNDMIAALEAYAKQQPEFNIAPDNHEGIRISFDEANGNGWFLVRLSLHDPLIPVNVESDERGGARIITEKLFSFLKGYDKLDLSPIENYLK
ncbi:phosphohexomutase domain-containing protein [Christensenella tenuis]|uniref:Phosphomannomutase/phosphoglucomutase n=1 Tax=Christensenella tenuis TaxID=2763033 RepID=A0ABR7EG81_9FIRM|nr:phosphomannomutase/phosphoglucomutase [Christensenella tenuis]MBC5648782.1 phosphomannomutase/phosphoglucomutase [Christensenella tenuis]